MHQEINPDTALGTHSVHYMCQRSRIYSGHLCSTGVEKGKKIKIKKIGLAIMNRTPWVLQRMIPMHWLTGIVIHLGSKGWLCRTGLFGPTAMYIRALHCSSQQQPPRQPGPDPSHDFGCTGAPCSLSCPVQHGNLCPVWTGCSEWVQFCPSHCSSWKNFPATPAWPPSPLCSHRATKVLWSKQSNGEKEGQRKESTAGQSYSGDQRWLQSHWAIISPFCKGRN